MLKKISLIVVFLLSFSTLSAQAIIYEHVIMAGAMLIPMLGKYGPEQPAPKCYKMLTVTDSSGSPVKDGYGNQVKSVSNTETACN